MIKDMMRDRDSETALRQNDLPGRRKKKIILIEPASTHIHVYTEAKFPRLGCIILGSIAALRGYEVRVYIEDIHPVNYDDVFSADLVGISIITPTALQGYAMADKIRERGIPVVLGGIHASFMKEEALSHADFVIRGEAEDAWIQFLEYFEGKRSPEDIRGLSWWERGQERHNPDAPLPTDLDRFPLPDPKLVVGWNKTPVFPINTRRGCPFNCDFCTVWIFNGRALRRHSREYIREYLRLAQENEAKYIFLNDDIFNLPQWYALEVCEEAARIIPRVPKNGQFRWEVAKSDTLLRALKRAGFENLCIGFESFDSEILKGMRKKATQGDVIFAIKKILEWGFNIHGMFVAGAKGDTIENIRNTPLIARKLGISTFQLMIDTPLPGSDLEEERRRQGGKPITMDYRNYDGHHTVWELDLETRLTPFELNYEAMRAVEKFYSWWGRWSRLFIGDARNWYMRGIGRRLISRWFEDQRNLEYLEGLRKLEALET
jgi:radical SAM superfamily enzyme YgiQ (UPF0313 family)